MKPAALILLAGLVLPGPAVAQADDPVEPPLVSGGSVSCSELNSRAMEATLVIRQHASALSAGFEADARPQAMVLLAWLDQWAGRLQGLVDVAEFSSCLDDGDAESYRRVLAMAARVANTAREELLRPVRPAAQPQRRRY